MPKQISFDAPDLVDWRDVPDLLPRRSGKKVNVSTVWRWMTRGLRGQRLPSIVIAGRRYTSRSALQDWLEATSHDGRRGSNVREGQRRNKWQERIQDAERQLDEMGI